MSELLKYLVRRILLAIPTLLALSLIIFSTTAFLPLRDRVGLYVSPFEYNHPLHPVDPQIIIKKYNLNSTFLVQWTTWLSEVFKGNLGYSRIANNAPVTSVISYSFAASFELVMFSIPLVIIIGYKLGIISARRVWKKGFKGDTLDNITSATTTVGYSIPSFLLGMLFLLTFYAQLHWPTIGRLGLKADVFVHSSEFTIYTGLYTIDSLLNGEFWVFVDALQHLLLPMLTLILATLPVLVTVTRASMIGELVKPYVLASRSRGLSEDAVVERTKKPSAFPILTVSGILIANMLTGVVVVEYLFQITGLGYWLVEATTSWDYPLIIGISLLFCLIFIVSNLLIDVAYTYIDPRVKL